MQDFIDTHTHIYMPEFDIEGQVDNSFEGQSETVRRAIDAGVDMMIFPNVDCSTIEPMKKLHALFPESTRMAMGLHPTEVYASWKEDLSVILDELNSDVRYIAIGEIGMDLYWDKSFEKEQMEVFDRQVSVAEERALPLIIHCREALPQTLEVLKGHAGIRAVFHSFGGSVEDVEAIRRVGDYYFGINGIVTFKKSTLPSVLPVIGADRLLSETDSPYLSPVPFRGKRNESSRIPFVVAAMAKSLATTKETLAKQIMANASNLFSGI